MAVDMFPKKLLYGQWNLNFVSFSYVSKYFSDFILAIKLYKNLLATQVVQTQIVARFGQGTIVCGPCL